MDFGLIAATESGGINWPWWWAIAQMILGLGAVIFVHELGHFLVAKACGVKCEKFYLGFDAFDIKIGRHVIVPRALLKWKWGETEYGIGILPLGGYVKMLGQDDNPSNISEERKRSQVPQHEVSAGSLDLETTAVGPIDRSRLDPRSYQAKTVLQRMAIISAGVIMNLIFSVIFATIAFRIGVDYQPPIVGETLPGSPAHLAELEGAEILKVNGRSTTDGYYTFEHLIEEIVLSGPDRPIELEIRYTQSAKSSQAPIKKSVTPTLKLNAQFPDIASIGASAAQSNELGTDSVVKGQAAIEANPPLQDGDTIVSSNGSPIANMLDLRNVLALIPDRPVTLQVKRKKSESSNETDTLEVTIPTNPRVVFGMAMEYGPILTVLPNSPASEAGLEVGDIIETIDGQPAPDPTDLSFQLLAPAREQSPVRIGVRRKDASGNEARSEVSLVPKLPVQHQTYGNMRIAVDPLGVVLECTNKVRFVEPQGPADSAGVQAGDVVASAKFMIDEKTRREFFRGGQNDIKFKPGYVGFLDVIRVAQALRPPQPIQLTVERGSTKQDFTVTPVLSTTQFADIRGIRLLPIQRTYRSATWWDALKLGADRTYRDMGRVLKMLEKLIRGQVAIWHLGGPLTIADVATSEASLGSTRLLLFLTLLGANLAILNFLPIPILDGGHMMFLAYEGIFRRPVNERVQIILSFVGLFFIVGLMVLAISLDLGRYIF